MTQASGACPGPCRRRFEHWISVLSSLILIPEGAESGKVLLLLVPSPSNSEGAAACSFPVQLGRRQSFNTLSESLHHTLTHSLSLSLSLLRHSHPHTMQHSRKPIYDSPASAAPSPAEIHATTVAPEPVALPARNNDNNQSTKVTAETLAARVLGQPASPTPTQRLADQIKRARIFLHAQTVKAENSVDAGLTKALKLEDSFISTMQSLAPPKESRERLLPGSIYVLVAAMAGSIVARNRNLLLRGVVPAISGVGASYAVLPITTRNVGDLVWKYEEKYPVVRDNHLRIRNGVSHFVETGKAHSQMGYYRAVDKVQGVREAVEQWVSKGK
jgi:organizing structure protein 2